MYSPQLLDHFQNPRNAGELPNADQTVEVENPVCGDVIRLTAKIEGGIIREIRFKAKGCVPAIACGSALTELVSGKPVHEARQLQFDHVVASVGGLPQASRHAGQLALDALAKLLADCSRNAPQGS